MWTTVREKENNLKREKIKHKMEVELFEYKKIELEQGKIWRKWDREIIKIYLKKFPTVNLTVMYCKHILIKVHNKKRHFG